MQVERNSERVFHPPAVCSSDLQALLLFFLFLRLLAAMDLKGMHLVWDGEPCVRKKLRDFGTMMIHPVAQKWCEPSRKNAIANMEVLLPTVRRFVAGNPAKKVPYLAPLQREISRFFDLAGIQTSQQEVYKSAWGIRKMLGFLKRKCLRKEVTKAGLLAVASTGVIENRVKQQT